MNPRALLREAAAQLRGAGDSARLDAEILLGHVLGWTRAQLIARDDEALPPEAEARFRDIVARRAGGEPVAYLTGTKDFWSLSLRVTPDVLVPRPETELLVEWGLECVQDKPAPRIADLGTGSGAIALALASECRDATVWATDVSDAALAVAAGNARALGLDQVSFRRGRWFEAVDGLRFDLVVSNPPYVAEGDPHLDALRHEPARALTAGPDGLADLRAIVEAAPQYLEDGGWLLVEHGATQGGAVRALLQASGFEDVQSRRDLAGHERASGGRRQ
ncbi:MAG: peptide chain release factor N(5)-glutamine methyltransferase [Gammaproteobacteria bacterium]|nr:peptide chain release factor N(5)-glutamine methyltransferase [Gammaproteobacteria bacterium]